MNLGFKGDGKEQSVLIKVQTRRPEKMVVQLRDAFKPFTFYTNREATINGVEDFVIRLPQCPDNGIISVFNKRSGNLPEGKDKTFKLIVAKKQPLKKALNVFATQSSTVRNFLKFAQEFSERAGVLSDSLPDGASVYYSDDLRFRIDYVNVIRDDNKKIPNPVTGEMVPNPRYGKELKTPARISRENGVIEISKFYFKDYTVPMRMAILLHEFSHFYLNDNPRNESEADTNALTIYLSMGYPRIEAYQAWLEVFKGTDTPQNRERWKIIKTFIDDFESKTYTLIP